MLRRDFAAEIIVNTAARAYKCLIRADECSLADEAGRVERRRFQKEAIAECRALSGLLEIFFADADDREPLCKIAAEVRRMAAAWLHGEQRQTPGKGARK